MPKPAIYLAGPIADCSQKEIHSRRSMFSLCLGKKYEVLDPSRHLYGSKDTRFSASEIVNGDKADIDRSQVVLVDAWKPSVGTAMEVLYAFERGKLVVVIVPDGVQPNPWLVMHSHCIYCNSEILVALDFINGFDSYGGRIISTDNGDVRVPPELQRLAFQFKDLCDKVYQLNQKWWVDLKTEAPIQRNVGELLMLVTSELAEALEAHRKNKKDDHLPYAPGFETEIFDAIIRLADICGGMNLNPLTLADKLAYNSVRKDHTREGRLAEGGKAY